MFIFARLQITFVLPLIIDQGQEQNWKKRKVK